MKNEIDKGTRRVLLVFGVILNIPITFAGYYNLYWNMIISTISLIISIFLWVILGFLIICEISLYLDSKIKKKQYYKQLKDKKTKSGYLEHKREKKAYRGIDYELTILESESGSKWVALESDFEFPQPLMIHLRSQFKLRDDFLYYDSGMWEGRSIEYQWDKMNKIAKQEIDELYHIYENRDEILNNKIDHLKTIKTNLEEFIESLECE